MHRVSSLECNYSFPAAFAYLIANFHGGLERVAKLRLEVAQVQNLNLTSNTIVTKIPEHGNAGMIGIHVAYALVYGTFLSGGVG